jgi:prevent-host-death family protein
MYNNVHKGEPLMKQVSFTEFRRNAASLFDSVEGGETVLVTRHGKPVAEVTPVASAPAAVSWKNRHPPIDLAARGVSLSREILRERAGEHKKPR